MFLNTDSAKNKGSGQSKNNISLCFAINKEASFHSPPKNKNKVVKFVKSLTKYPVKDEEEKSLSKVHMPSSNLDYQISQDEETESTFRQSQKFHLSTLNKGIQIRLP